MYGLYLLENGDVLMDDRETILSRFQYQEGNYKPEHKSLPFHPERRPKAERGGSRFCRKLCVETQEVDECLGFRRRSDRTAEMGGALV